MNVIPVMAFAIASALAIPAYASDINSSNNTNSHFHEAARLWLQSRIAQTPQVKAAAAQQNSRALWTQAAAQPLYNPELQTRLEQEGSNNNYALEISQKIDWWNQREARSQQQQRLQQQAGQQYQQSLQQTTADALAAIVRYQSAQQRDQLMQRLQQQQQTLTQLIEQRRSIGDLSALDAELALLAQSSLLADIAASQAELSAAAAQLSALLPDWQQQPQYLNALIQQLDNSAQQLSQQPLSDEQFRQLALSHPQSESARLFWLAEQQRAQLSRDSLRAEPTLGVSAGRNGEEDVLGLALSLPLNVRSSYRQAAAAANGEALQAEAEFYVSLQQQQQQLRASHSRVQAYRRQVKQWQTLMSDGGQRSAQLLQQQWRNGDLSTSAYIQASAQWAASLQAGIELTTDYRQAQIQWLSDSQNIRRFLSAAANTNSPISE
ncbi:TolC family protein [Thalassolituus pacificus]|uniref:TolC family protein n=1 Tax=Thalassolituus pacificus TaxID=2975440 RepID=A0A9X3AJU4_9GAMM|nr:TolC family protein [Thalassolituus pacificus]MCT7361172.1 TolC family protein [Thalassolituus pacificus]